MKTDLFWSCGHCWVFHICWHIECCTFTVSSFRIWNSSTAIPSPSLALFVVMLPKAHLTWHSRMPGSRWVITPSWLPGSWRSFLDSSVYSCHLLVSSASVRSLLFLSFIEPIFAWNVPLVSLIFLKRSLVFPILLFSSLFALIAEEGFLISLCYCLELCIQMRISVLYSFAFPSHLFTAICKASSDNHFAFLFLGDGLDSCLLYNVNCTLETTVLYRVLGNWDSSKWCAKLRNEQSCFYQKPQYSGKRQTSS